ncbi:OmpA family protein [Sphingomonas sp. Tas61C01]|uniref:OmpA family protein n=1 Tax=Sphingomonas sp. Tas61C01 TaxID=3458297 RepID=UPI00403E99EE
MADPDDRRTDGAPPNHIHIEKKKTNWLAWILLALGLLALLFALSRCGKDDDAYVAPALTASATSDGVVAATPDADRSTVLAGTTGLGAYLAGKEPVPRSFTFEKLNFDTANSAIRAQDADEIATVATTLKQYPTTHVRIAGYADARGSEPANAALGKARADSVKAALIKQGIDAGRIETASGGESDPVGSNATTPGQAENRRTEIVVTRR